MWCSCKGGVEYVERVRQLLLLCIEGTIYSLFLYSIITFLLARIWIQLMLFLCSFINFFNKFITMNPDLDCNAMCILWNTARSNFFLQLHDANVICIIKFLTKRDCCRIWPKNWVRRVPSQNFSNKSDFSKRS